MHSPNWVSSRRSQPGLGPWWEVNQLFQCFLPPSPSVLPLRGPSTSPRHPNGDMPCIRSPFRSSPGSSRVGPPLGPAICWAAFQPAAEAKLLSPSNGARTVQTAAVQDSLYASCKKTSPPPPPAYQCGWWGTVGRWAQLAAGPLLLWRGLLAGSRPAASQIQANR